MGLATATVALKQRSDDSEHPVINYTKTETTDPISRLQKRIDSGEFRPAYYGRHGYLRSVLEALKIPVSSQMLVFSKTSFQHDLISPESPRALYFNDSVSVGWVQGGSVLEIAASDPQLGTVFYTLAQNRVTKPRFERQTNECLQCHGGGMTRDVPGYMFRSVFARADGQPEFRAGTKLTTDQSPISERWGGWYVTGKHGEMRHMGNVFAKGGEEVTLDRERGANITDLAPLFNTSPYLGKTSDIVALMVAEHQAQTYNYITRANYLTRIALDYDAQLNKEWNRPKDYRSEGVTRRIASACEALVRAMLFVEEAPLTAQITGTSGFAEQFARQAPFDKKGRSLHQLDLATRLMRYPCSYLIYSEAFTALPPLAKETIYRRLQEILTGKETGKEFAHLTLTDKQAIHEILTDTCPDYATLATRQNKAGEQH